VACGKRSLGARTCVDGGCLARLALSSFFVAWLFVDAFAEGFSDGLNILLPDDSGAHMAQRLALPANVRPLSLPP
jgi:hypothetical protein